MAPTTFARPEDVWGYDPEVNTTQARELIASATSWVLYHAPSLRFADVPPPPAREAVALLAAVFASDPEAEVDIGRVPNMVRLMIHPWRG